MRFLFLFLLSLSMHGDHLALFSFYQQNEVIMVKASFTTHEFMMASKVTYNDINEEVITNYLKDHFEIHINESFVDYYMDNFNLSAHHFDVFLKLECFYENVEKITIKNTCLLNYNENHSNVIQLRFNDSERDFLMNTMKSQLTINL